MLLVIDVGNTNTVFGLFDEERLVGSFRFSTGRPRTADEFYIDFTGALDLRGFDPEEVGDVILGSVVPPVMPALLGMCREHLGVDPLVVGPGVKTGISIRYNNPREVGADRIVNSAAAFARVQDSVVVVDFGTATTFDCISSRGEYVGGVIAPGIQVSSEALFRATAKLPKIDITKPSRAVGRTTVGAIQSGFYYGYLGLIEGILRAVRQDMGQVAKILATGGLAEMFSSESSEIDEVVPDLTLQGLRIIYDRNR